MINSKTQKAICIIGPGYIAINDKPTLLCSVCGSGIIVAIWDRVNRNGGLAHCVFPQRKRTEKSTNYHVDVAIPRLLSQLIYDYNSDIDNLEAQLFGGGSPDFFPKTKPNRLINATRKMLNKYRIGIISEDVGGHLGRKIVFDTTSGDAVVYKTKKIRKSDWAADYVVGLNNG